MTDIADVRELVPDNPQAATLTAIGDGATTRFTLPYFPVVLGSSTVRVGPALQVEDTDYIIYPATGVIEFAAPLAEGDIVTVDYQHTMLTDGFYERALARQGDNAKLAAADAVGAIARDQALLLKVVRLLDSSMDGATLSRELRQHETALRKQAEDELQAGGDEDTFAVIEMVPDTFSYRERLWANRLRGIVG